MRHVALFLYGLTGGGATRRTLALAEGFSEHGLRTDLVVIDPTGPLAERLPPALNLIALDSWALRFRRRFRPRRRPLMEAAAPALAEYLRRHRPDLLLSAANHAHMSAVEGRRLSATGIPLVLRVSNHLTASHEQTGQLARLQRARTLYGEADAAIAVCHDIAADLRRHVPVLRERVFVATNPTLTPEIETLARQPVDHPWADDPSRPLIVAAGRLSPQKDFPTLIRALARLRQPARLVILGEGKQRPQLERLIRSLGLTDRVVLPGFTTNPYAWMARADLFVLSSRWEGFPGVLVEAMACGCPVVSTDCPSGPRELLENGRLGPLVPVGDDQALAEAMQQALQTPADVAALRHSAWRYTPARAVAEYLQILQTVSGRAGRTRPPRP
ncbi:N-acetylgalactosamine-N,N'-diacetylbacillosaminyl-diphospho-undecaprenol 4-alpha-N-acetylgalactosaminyltransferase [Methylomarinovum caldicuralii]|uniref:N-acetylgalactosamine-N,N'-diacetylbacillosaminyl-diphospho-undecaprenol 4-alpha-N-acetylgalactosaminyltransferase n=1 Tax=Methylomarinovum caldicuralii TaxID=438856 RepID=A0AAU9C4T6_9GAMM|nr:glycosyltransferase [Methylomarinovum caldicuralii]BCX82768.1 N-acetylgalactosamine-N,N'-diacetylbacillosaminyl-diphospho-undecaprenol 4-alpha-N-acetylgalactosaminyltransferase [Methylomarinovum caldicuralii]